MLGPTGGRKRRAEPLKGGPTREERALKDPDIEDRFPDDETLKEVLEKAWEDVAGPADLDEPDWEPLERALPEAECAGFMFMGYSEDQAGIRLYKHGITRRYLALDERGRAYRYTAFGYVEIPLDVGIDEVFEGLEEAGRPARPSTTTSIAPSAMLSWRAPGTASSGSSGREMAQRRHVAHHDAHNYGAMMSHACAPRLPSKIISR